MCWTIKTQCWQLDENNMAKRTRVKYSEGSSCFRLLKANKLVGCRVYRAEEVGKASCLDLPPMFELLWGSLPFTLSLSTYFQSYNWLSERTRRSGDVDNFCKTSNFWHFGGAANRPWLTCSLLKTMWLHGWEGLVKQFQLEVLGPSKPQLRHVTQGVGCPLEKEGSMWLMWTHSTRKGVYCPFPVPLSGLASPPGCVSIQCITVTLRVHM